jgi:hypothetical protein
MNVDRPITFSAILSAASIEAFHDRAVLAALQGLLARRHSGIGIVDDAFTVAKDATERRFRVKLVLPGDGE